MLPVIEGLLTEERLRLLAVVDAVDTRVVGEEEMRVVDPGFGTIRNLNHPEDYRKAFGRWDWTEKALSTDSDGFREAMSVRRRGRRTKGIDAFSRPFRRLTSGFACISEPRFANSERWNSRSSVTSRTSRRSR